LGLELLRRRDLASREQQEQAECSSDQVAQ
jgi:hypothetical protein